MQYPPDRGLPLVQLKKQRRELVVRAGPITDDELKQIAVIQQAISGFEDVIADLDCEVEAKCELIDQRGLPFPAFGKRASFLLRSDAAISRDGSFPQLNAAKKSRTLRQVRSKRGWLG